MPTNFRGVAAVSIAAALVLSGCASTPEADSPAPEAGGTFPVSIEHAFGETEIPAQPERVVTWGWGSADAALALGVVPVAIPFEAYAGDENGVLPWIADELTELGAETPTMLPESPEEPPYEDIIAADPDVILAGYSGITEEQYAILSDIAPTVAYPETAWSTPWRDLIEIVGTALGKTTEAATLLEDIDAEIAAQADAHPEFAGKTIAATWDVGGVFYVYKPADPRVEFLLDLGFENAPSVDALANGDATFYYTLSYEELDKIDAEVVVAYADTQAEADTFVTARNAIPAVKAGNLATVVGTEYISAVSPPTALSLTWGLDELIAALEKAVTK
ncbi:iron-siderophore ABC transporter substrate-binding protein [Glaciihabitans arcticus]|uniref:Iron-siderophore ABC transporter substrate-binding protein n=1 Tax=Glaciihabitans arcticus TaxID=2668039 RepID=A0A4Q9GX42_9MICO|nr:ABC transporter substrate-binding protein [Glaciihabitans arcticus]TBN56830.1 iron-siderophore ABC transporter substrate-binding protein [Glaciihabitans arcticus]